MKCSKVVRDRVTKTRGLKTEKKRFSTEGLHFSALVIIMLGPVGAVYY